jgi:hypothetical protein
LREPTPLRPTAEEPAPPDADPDEAELLETVLEAQRERAAEDEPEIPAPPQAEAVSEPEAEATPGEATVNGIPADPEIVELRATEVEVDVEPERAPEPEPEPEPQPSDEAAAPPDQALGARLVALQMAVAGGNRGEVEAHLRRAFELADPADILDDIFGSGTNADKRVVWPEVG